jgi:hypothetical protein
MALRSEAPPTAAACRDASQWRFYLGLYVLSTGFGVRLERRVGPHGWRVAHRRAGTLDFVVHATVRELDVLTVSVHVAVKDQRDRRGPRPRQRAGLTSREADVPYQGTVPIVPPPPRPSAHANRPGPAVSSTPDAQAHVEFPPRVGVTRGPSDANEQRLRPDASDDALRRPQGLHQVVYEGWVAYFDCHCRCHAPRVAAGEARTSHFRQKRSPVKAAAAARRAQGLRATS